MELLLNTPYARFSVLKNKYLMVEYTSNVQGKVKLVLPFSSIIYFELLGDMKDCLVIHTMIDNNERIAIRCCEASFLTLLDGLDNYRHWLDHIIIV